MRKRGLAVIMAMAMLCNLSACAKKGAEETATVQESSGEAETAIETSGEEETTDQAEPGTSEAGTYEEKDTDPATSESGVSEELTADSELEELLEQLYEKKKPQFGLFTTAVDLSEEYSVSSYTGLTMEEAGMVDAAVASEPLMSSQAYSLVLVRVKDAADTAAVAEKMTAGINQRKWICVEADDLQVVTREDIIMLIMVQSNMSISSEDMVDAFTQACGEPDGAYKK